MEETQKKPDALAPTAVTASPSALLAVEGQQEAAAKEVTIAPEPNSAETKATEAKAEP